MGGVATVLKDVFTGIEDKLGGDFLTRSGGRLLRSTPSGEVMFNFLKDTFQPAVQKAIPQFVSRGLSPVEAKASALGMARNHFNFNTKVIQTIQGASRQIHPSFAQMHADNLADFFSVYLGEEGHQGANWRKQAGASKVVSPYQAPLQKGGEKLIKSIAGPMFLGRIAIPHLNQWINSVLVNGTKATAQAAAEMFRDPKLAASRVMWTGALNEELGHQFYQLGQSKGQVILDKLIHSPGMRFVRKWEITWSALAGKYSAMDAFEGLKNNPTDKESILALKFFGIDHAQALARGALSPDEIDKAMLRSAQETMFVNQNVLNTPFKWQENAYTRLGFLYRNYQFNEFRLISDQIKLSYKKGPASLLKTMAVLTALFPMAGELTKIAENYATGHGNEDNSKENLGGSEYIDALAHAATFGTWYSMLRSAKRRQLTSWALGPVYSSVVDTAQDAMLATTGSVKPIERDVLRKVPVVGPALSHKLVPTEKSRFKKRARVY